jgi:uncharacterized protein
MANRLAAETSPYLLQHKDNPVDWYPWGEEAFSKATEEGKPIFLSIGYSSCHWCHVMEHESFESDEVAALLNPSFVCVKVDREERPDVDEAYMTAVQLSTGHGGWPMSVFLTPDKKPFFAGTYFPKEDRGQHPGLMTMARKITELWNTKRAELESNAEDFAHGLTEALNRKAPATFAKLDEDLIANAIRALASDFDNQNGGFGGAPKFPPHTSIDFLLRYALRDSAPKDLRELALGMAMATLEQMTLGGLHDHVGGGYHRYSTDAEWHLPHFEKMLYDNALMLSNLSFAAGLLADAGEGLAKFFGRAAAGIVNWALTEMRTDDGLFSSALDADSEGEEGKFYVWAAAEARSVLGDRADTFMKAYAFEEGGNFEDEATHKLTGANIPHRVDDGAESFEAELALLHENRAGRVRPGLDNKALVSWNGLMIAALAQAGLTEVAEEAAARILRESRLPHQIVEGAASGEAFLDDYAAFALSLFQLDRTRAVQGKEAGPWRSEAIRLTQEMVGRFWDDEECGFFATSPNHEELFGRTKPVFDSPTPSANALALRCLLEVGDRQRAERLVNAMLGWMERAPQATEALLAAAMVLAEPGEVLTSAGPAEVAVGAPLELGLKLEPREIRADENGNGQGVIILDIPQGLHINSNTPPARWLTPTSLTFQPVKAEIEYPTGIDDVYEGQTRIPFTVKLPSGSSGEEFEVRVSFQPCTDTECLLPQEKVLSGVIVR